MREPHQDAPDDVAEAGFDHCKSTEVSGTDADSEAPFQTAVVTTDAGLNVRQIAYFVDFRGHKKGADRLQSREGLFTLFVDKQSCADLSTFFVSNNKLGGVMTNEALPDRAVKKATNLIRDARQAIVVGLIPVLGLIFILRLVQWYLLRNQHPSLATDSSELATNFRSALHRLWFAVLFWPVLVLFLIAYFSLT